MATLGLIVLALAVLVIVWAVFAYNRIITARNRADSSWSQVDVELRRRRDLVPKLVETVGGYATHERETFDRVATARAAAEGAAGPAQASPAEGSLGAAVGRLLAVGEAYPELRAQAAVQRAGARAARHRGPHSDRPPGLQRHGAHVQQPDPDGADLVPRVGDARAAVGLLRARRRSMSKIRNAFWAVVVVVILALSFAPGAIGSLVSGFHFPGSRYYDLPSARVDAVVKRDGSVRVTETITFSFHGSYSGAFRDIPLGPGQSISDVRVAENGIPYQPGASTVLGSFGSPGSFGDVQLPDRERIVWHYSAFDEPRAFTLSYVLHGVLIVHPDVVDMNMNVWGDGWPSELGTLFASVRLPDGTTPTQGLGQPAVHRADALSRTATWCP